MEYFKAKRLEEVRKTFSKLTTESTTSVDGISNLIRQSELGGILGLKRRSVQRIVTRHLKPMGAVVKIGQRNHIHVWGVQRLLNMVGRCADCGRHWDDKLALAELKGEITPESVKLGTFGIQGGLAVKEKINKMLPKGEKITFADLKGGTDE